MSEPEPPICEPGGSGTFFPLFEAEQTWPDKVRSVIYAALLIYVFLGVSIVADLFMESITAITSEKRRVKNKKTGSIVTVKRWNATVSNLTLMALGSSAPEILLSIMEMIKEDFYSGELGPSTIVGSAAFNLFCIIGVCIVCIPSPQTRAIKSYIVFVITATFSIIAYLWLVFIVQVSSPDVIEVWEGLTTLLFFPILIFISWLGDIGWLDRPDPKAVWGLADAEAPYLKDERSAMLASKPICDSKGKVIRNAPGVFSFVDEVLEFTPEDAVTPITIEVLRCNGTRGFVTCKFKTERLTAVPGYDYIETQGILHFEEGSRSKQISIDLKPRKPWKRSDEFQVILSDATGGVLFNPNDDGGEDTCVATVTIVHGRESQICSRPSDRMKHSIDYCCNIDSCARTYDDWREQIKDALCRVSSDDDEEDGDQDTSSSKAKQWSGIQMLMHIVSLPWKLFFAVVIPPVELSGGWACFIVSLACIGAVTSLIIDLAELFGCVVGIQDSVVAITFVALGTSMPDLFASWKEALEAPEADASIVNVTGSNSVNVFLGIGIPWTMAAVYWAVADPTPKWRAMYPNFLSKYPSGAFIVLGGNLAFSVVVFTLSAAVACLVLWVRRKYVGGELGGPAGSKALSGFLFCMLWLFYICLSIWKTENPDATAGQQVFAVVLALCALQNIVLFLGGGLSLYCTWLSANGQEAGESGGSWEQALVPALQHRGMMREDFSAVLEQVEEPRSLREAALDPEAFVQKLAATQSSEALNCAAMALAMAELRPKIEADVYKLHGLSWEDFLPALRRVKMLHLLRQAVDEPHLFLEGLENGSPLEAAKEFFTAKLVTAARPLQSRLGAEFSEEAVEAIAARLVSNDSFDNIKKMIADPESLWESCQSSPGFLGSASVAVVRRRSVLEHAFNEEGLSWPQVMETIRRACQEQQEVEEEVAKCLSDDASLKKVITIICNWAKKFALDTLQEELNEFLSLKERTPEELQAIWKQLPLKDMVLATEDLKHGKSADAVWGNLVKASHDGRRQQFIAQIKRDSEVLSDAWMQMLPQLHALPLRELQKAAQDRNARSALLKLLEDGSADIQDPFVDCIGTPQNRSWNKSLNSTRISSLEADLFKVSQSFASQHSRDGSHNRLWSDLYAASQPSLDGSHTRLPSVGCTLTIEQCKKPQVGDQRDRHELHDESKTSSHRTQSRQSVMMVETDDEGVADGEANGDDTQRRDGSRVPLMESGIDTPENRPGLERLQGTLERTCGVEAGLPGPTSTTVPRRQHSLRDRFLKDTLPSPTSSMKDVQGEKQHGGTFSTTPGTHVGSNSGRFLPDRRRSDVVSHSWSGHPGEGGAGRRSHNRSWISPDGNQEFDELAEA